MKRFAVSLAVACATACSSNDRGMGGNTITDGTATLAPATLLAEGHMDLSQPPLFSADGRRVVFNLHEATPTAESWRWFTATSTSSAAQLPRGDLWLYLSPAGDRLVTRSEVLGLSGGGAPTVFDTGYRSQLQLGLTPTPDWSRVLALTDDGALLAWPITGGTPVTLATEVREWAVSPDSARVAVVTAAFDVKLVTLSTRATTTVASDACQISFSPTGAWLIADTDTFLSGGESPMRVCTRQRAIPTAGGAESLLPSLKWQQRRFGPGDATLYGIEGGGIDPSRLLSVPVAGGEVVELAADDPLAFTLEAGGRTILYRHLIGEDTELKAIPAAGGEPTVLATEPTDYVFWQVTPAGRVVFGTIGPRDWFPYSVTYKSVPLGGGEVVTLTDGLTTTLPPEDAPARLAPGGARLVYLADWRSETEGGTLRSVPVTGGPAAELAREVLSFQVSPDGGRVAFLTVSLDVRTSFFATSADPGTLAVTPIDGGAVTPRLDYANSYWWANGATLYAYRANAPPDVGLADGFFRVPLP